MQSKYKTHKSTASQLIVSPAIGPHHILRDDAARLLIIDHEQSVTFSEMQYRTLKPLLSGSGIVEEDLLEAVYGDEAALMGHEALDQLIRKIRSRLRPVGLTVLRVEQSSYMLLAIPERAKLGRGKG